MSNGAYYVPDSWEDDTEDFPTITSSFCSFSGKTAKAKGNSILQTNVAPKRENLEPEETLWNDLDDVNEKKLSVREEYLNEEKKKKDVKGKSLLTQQSAANFDFATLLQHIQLTTPENCDLFGKEISTKLSSAAFPKSHAARLLNRLQQPLWNKLSLGELEKLRNNIDVYLKTRMSENFTRNALKRKTDNGLSFKGASKDYLEEEEDDDDNDDDYYDDDDDDYYDDYEEGGDNTACVDKSGDANTACVDEGDDDIVISGKIGVKAIR